MVEKFHNKNTKLINSNNTKKFSDITYLLQLDIEKLAGLSTVGDIYIWERRFIIQIL